MIFPHKEKLYPSVLSCSFIISPSHSCYVFPAPQQDSQIFCSSPFQGKDVGRWILTFRDSCLICAPILMIFKRMVSNWAEAHSVPF